MQTAFTPPTGLISEDTVFAAPGRWANGSLARFFQGNWQVKGGWERLTLDNLGGVCRAVLSWTLSDDSQAFAFGLHNGLKVWNGGLVSDITPPRPGATIPLDAVHSITDPIFTASGDNKVRVVQFTHGRTVGQTVRLAGLTNVGGLNVNGDWVIVTGAFSDVNNFYVQHTSNATSTAQGGGTAGTVQATPFDGFVDGEVDGTGGAGYGTGAYGVGTYGTPSNVEYFPLTWSLATWGGNLIANPRGRTIYEWEQDTAVAAVPLAGAPAEVTYMVVVPQRQVMALGCNEQVSGVFNPLCIRWSDIEDNEDWAATSANNAGEWILESGGRIVCARVVGDYVFVWTADALFLGTFIGAPGQTWRFERIGAQCGAVSPGAPIVKSQQIAWMSPDRVFWTCALGGAPQVVVCPIREMFVEHVTAGQDDKIVGGTTSTFGEFTWFWPDDRDGFECSRSLTYTPEGWSRDLLARSAYIDAGPQPYPVGVAPTGQVYWHEKGHSSDGGPLTGFLESTDFYISEAEAGVLINGVYPDFKNQQGPVRLTLYTREFPQSTQRPHGPWSLAPGQNKRSFRLSGRIVRVRYDWSSAPAYARGGKSEFDMQRIGGRG